MTQRNQHDWLILRCASAQTLRLADSLNEAGFEAWTPRETVERRSREGAKPVPVTSAMMGSYVFAKADRMIDLIELSRSPALLYRIWDSEQCKMVTKGHPHFRPFRHMGVIKPMPDRHLVSLRQLERKRTPAPPAEALDDGERVRLKDAGFEGLWATVEHSTKVATRVMVDGWIIPVTFPTWSLRQALDEGADSGVSSAKAQIARAA